MLKKNPERWDNKCMRSKDIRQGRLKKCRISWSLVALKQYLEAKSRSLSNHKKTLYKATLEKCKTSLSNTDKLLEFVKTLRGCEKRETV